MTQTDLIFEHLQRHGSITPMEALREYGVYRLAARVNELRADGCAIQTEMVERRSRGRVVKVAEYKYHAKA